MSLLCPTRVSLLSAALVFTLSLLCPTRVSLLSAALERGLKPPVSLLLAAVARLSRCLHSLQPDPILLMLPRLMTGLSHLASTLDPKPFPI